MVCKDVAKVLRYSNPRKAINDHCRYVTKRDVPSLGKSRYGAEYTQYKEMSFIPESIGKVFFAYAKKKKKDNYLEAEKKSLLAEKILS